MDSQSILGYLVSGICRVLAMRGPTQDSQSILEYLCKELPWLSWLSKDTYLNLGCPVAVLD